MKITANLKWVMIILLSSLLFNCQEDESLEPLDQTIAMKGGSMLPANPLNPYDLFGLLHNEVLDAYLYENHEHESLEEIAGEIKALLSSSYSGYTIMQTYNLDVSELENILQNPSNSLDAIVNNSGLPPLAKVDLTIFLSALIAIENDDFSGAKSLITAYESTVLLNPLYAENDKRILLTVSSIIRYSFYYRIGRDEGDWDSSVSHRAAAVKGALSSSLDAVALSLIVSIENIQSNR